MTTPAVSVDEVLERFLSPFDRAALEGMIARGQPLIGSLGVEARTEVAAVVRGFGWRKALLRPAMASVAIARMRPDLADLLKKPETQAWLSSEVQLLRDLGNWTAKDGDPPGGAAPR